MKTRLVGIVPAVAALVALSGCGNDGTAASEGLGDRAAEQPQENPPEPADSEGVADDPGRPGGASGRSSAPGGLDQMLAAGAAAQSQLGGTVVTIDWERTVWEVTVVMADGSEHDVVLSADGRDVLAGPFGDHEDAEDLRENQTMVDAATLPYAEAALSARRAAAGGVLSDLDLELDYGQAIWEASYSDATGSVEKKVTIANDGSVLYNGVDD